VIAKPVINWVTDRVLMTRKALNQPPPDYESIYPMAREFYQKAYAKGLDVKFGLAAGVMQAGLMAPLSAFSAVVMFFLFLTLTQSKTKALGLACLYAFATPVFFRTGQLNHNLLQSHFALFSFALLYQPWKSRDQIKPVSYFWAGLLAGWTVVLDYSGVVLLGGIAIYAIMRWNAEKSLEKKKSALVLFGVGALISISFLIGYQWLAFGNPIYPAQSYMPPTQYSSYGYQGIDWPKIDLLWENIFNPRYGILISAPIFFLALYLPGWYNARIRIIGRLETIYVFILVVGMFIFTAANQFSRMQFNSGIRHLVPVSPFLFFIVAGVILAMPRWLSIPVAVFSTIWSWCLAMYRDVEQGRGVIESVLYVIRHGVLFPWMETLDHLHLLPQWISPWFVFFLASGLVALIWLLHLPGSHQKIGSLI
jgi:hypothetical protein